MQRVCRFLCKHPLYRLVCDTSIHRRSYSRCRLSYNALTIRHISGLTGNLPDHRARDSTYVLWATLIS